MPAFTYMPASFTAYVPPRPTRFTLQLQCGSLCFSFVPCTAQYGRFLTMPVPAQASAAATMEKAKLPWALRASLTPSAQAS